MTSFILFKTNEFGEIPKFNGQAEQADRQTNIHDIVFLHKTTAMSDFDIMLKCITVS